MLSGHTIRFRNNYWTSHICCTMRCTRPFVEVNTVPVTEVDSLLSYKEIRFLQTPFYRKTINKQNLFTDFVNACEEFAVEKSVKYNKSVGVDEVTYSVPVTGCINLLNPEQCRDAGDNNLTVDYYIYLPRDKCRKKFSHEIDCIANITENRHRNSLKKRDLLTKKNRVRCFKDFCDDFSL